MSRSHLLLLLVLLAGIGLAVWLLAGGLSTGPDGDEIAREGESTGTGDLETLPGDRAHDDEGEGYDGPVLFGRPREQQVGRGLVAGKVLEIDTGTAVGEARLLLTGTGFGDESVTLRAESDAEGSFRVPDVPAGPDYALRIEAEGFPGRTIPAVAVRDGSVTNLGTLWLGQRTAFEGRVVNDKGLGVPRADVQVHAGHLSIADLWGNMSELFSKLDQEPEPLARATTDGQGWFRFEALDPGPVTLSVRAPGYESRQVLAVVADDTAAAELTVRLAEGSVVSGRVVDPQGGGLAGARVAALAGNDPLSFLYGRSFATTEADGSFRVDAAATTDEIMLLASAPGYPVTMTRTTPGASDVEILLDRSATLVLRLLEASDESPVEGAHLLVGISDSAEARTGPTTIVSGVTDATGRATFDVHPGALQMVWMTHPDGTSALWSPRTDFAGPIAALKGPADPTVKAGRQEFLLHLLDLRSLEGTVRDAAGLPVAGAQVFTFAGLQFGRPVVTDDDGRYRLSVPTGSSMTVLIVRAIGYVQTQAVVRAEEGKPLPEKDVTLTRAAVLTGRVVTPDGRPVAGARVRAKTGARSGLVGAAFLGEAEGLTSRDGRYVLDGVSPGEEVRVLARHASFVDAASEPLTVETDRSIRVPDLVLGSGLQLEVIVRAPDGRPLADARVELDYEREGVPDWDDLDLWSGDAGLRTNAQGRARAERVPPCRLTVTASHPPYARSSTTRDVKATDASPLSVEVRLRPAAVVAGRVLDETGQPVAGAWVTVQPEGETRSFESTTTDQDGRFRIEGVPEGPFTLRVNVGGYKGRTLPVPAASETLEVRLEPMSADVAARREEIYARMVELQASLAEAKSDAERQTIGEEIGALSRELQSLRDESD